MTPVIDMPETLVVQEIQAPLHLIRDPLDARPLDAAHTANLAVSMSEVGLENAISLRLLRPEEVNQDGCVWMRTRGGHRLAAARALGWAAISAKVRDEQDEIAKLAEIDENLLRRDYTPLERAQAFAERLEAWAAAHPDRVEKVDGQARAKRGRPGKSAKIADFLNGRPPLMGFASETARRQADAQALAGRLQGLFGLSPAGEPRRMLRVTLELTAERLAARLGQTVEISAGELGGGGRFVLLGEEPMRPRRDLVVWTLWG